jgi:nicotinate-nucleotide adenylyltransferase
VARVGLLGGSFNPPHVGHMLCAQEALAALELDRVLLMPVHAPPHKAMQADPGPEVRLELCRLAVADAAGIEVTGVEIERPGRSYTVDTLRALHDARPEDDLTFIAGADQACGLPGWREPAAVLELAELAVAEREATRRDDVREALYGLPGADERVRFFAMPRIDVSSSLIRRRVAEGRPIRWLVPDAVAAAIAERGLYRSQVGAR